jgi:hypothetical protein
MPQQGAKLPDIAEVLRHRSYSSTEIYRVEHPIASECLIGLFSHYELPAVAGDDMKNNKLGHFE